jgi:glutathione peroxidase
MSVYDFTVKDAKGEDVSLRKYEGKVLLIVNVASKCGYTPQYKELAEIREKYHDRGFEVLAFPCNQFGWQEPGTEDEICEFAKTKYNANFPIFHKIDVNGGQAAPLFDFLKKEQTGILGTTSVKWNFTKFLVDRNGKCVHRFGPNETPTSFAQKQQDMPLTANLRTYHGNHLSARDNDSVMLVPNNNEWEQFKVIFLGDGRVALRTHFGKHLSARPEGYVISVPQLDEWEKFTLVDVGNGRHALRSHHGTHLSARDNGTVTLVPNLNEWEAFQFNFRPVAFRSHHGNHVSARQDGTVTLVPNLNEWEYFHPVLHRGKVGFRGHHGKYLSARDDGSVNQQPHLLEWELFEPVGHDRVHLRTHHRNHVSARDNGWVTLVPNNNEWEQYVLV